MKKRIFLVIMCILLICPGAYAKVTETLVNDVKADKWLEGSGFTTSTGTYPAGTLPDPPGNKYTDPNTDKSGEIRVCNYNVVKAAYDGDNAVFKFEGPLTSTGAALTNVSNSGAPIKKYSVKVKINAEAATVVTNIIAPGWEYYPQANGSGITVKDGGAYINDAKTNSSVKFIEDGTIQNNKWYTIDTMYNTVSSGVTLCAAKVYDDKGTLIGNSGYHYSYTGVGRGDSIYNFYSFQQSVYGLTNDETVLFDDWKAYTVMDDAKANFTLSTELAELNKIKIVSDIKLDALNINADTVELTAENLGISLEGTYSVTYEETSEENAIVITTNAPLPYNETYTVALKGILATADGTVATDYPNGFSTTFNSGNDPFAVNGCNFDTANEAKLTLSNTSARDREYLAIASVYDTDGKYISTSCKYGKVTAKTTSGSVVTLPYADGKTGRTVKIMVWDNWNDMNSLSQTYTYTIK